MLWPVQAAEEDAAPKRNGPPRPDDDVEETRVRATERRGCGLHGASRAGFWSRRHCGDAVGWEVAGHRGEGGARGGREGVRGAALR